MIPRGGLLKDVNVRLRAEKHVGCVMNERRKHQVECAADESMYVHGEQRRNSQSKAFHESAAFALLPPRPLSYGGLSSRGTELLGLQVQGFCCPLQQRPSSGRVTHRVKPQSREERGDGNQLMLLSSLKGRLESRAKPASRSRTGGRPEMTPVEGGAMHHYRDPLSETAETPTTSHDNERHAHHGQPGATKVSELHLYLPSLLCDDEEQDAETEEMRTSAEQTSTLESEVKPNNANPPVSPDPSHIGLDQPNSGPGTPQPTF